MRQMIFDSRIEIHGFWFGNEVPKEERKPVGLKLFTS